MGDLGTDLLIQILPLPCPWNRLDHHVEQTHLAEFSDRQLFSSDERFQTQSRNRVTAATTRRTV